MDPGDRHHGLRRTIEMEYRRTGRVTYDFVCGVRHSDRSSLGNGDLVAVEFSFFLLEKLAKEHRSRFRRAISDIIGIDLCRSLSYRRYTSCGAWI